MRLKLSRVALLLAAACGPSDPTLETRTDERELVVPRAWVRSVSVTTPAGHPADIYLPRPPRRLRRFFRDAFPVVVILQGALVDKSQYSGFAEGIARHGFTVVVPNRLRAVAPGAPPALFTEGAVIADALALAEALDDDPGRFTRRIIDTDQMAITGHSFGGAVGLFVIGEICGPPLCILPAPLPEEVRAAAFYGTNLVQPPPVGLVDIDTGGLPVALLRGTEDGVSTPAETGDTFTVLDDGRALITVDGANHFGITDDPHPPGSQPDPNPSTIPQEAAQRRIARWTALWLRSQLRFDPVATFWLFRVGRSLDGSVTVDEIR